MSDSVVDLVPAWLVAIAVLFLMFFAVFVGERLRARYPAAQDEDAATQEGYMVSGVVGLLALLLGFTFSLAVDRFETRRTLVLEEANAIHLAYLRSQTLDEPHRTKMDGLLIKYLDNRLALGSLAHEDDHAQLLKASHELQDEMWQESIVAIAKQRDDVSAAYLESIGDLIETAAARRSAREAHVPRPIFVVILVYMIGTALTISFAMGPRRRRAIAVMLVLTTLSYGLIIDIDTPTSGAIREGQWPMEEMKVHLSRSKAPASAANRVSPRKFAGAYLVAS